MEIQNLIKARITRLLSAARAQDGETSLDIGRIDYVHILKGVGAALLSGILGASRCVFSCYPFGLAYLCSTDKYVLYSYVGLIVSALLNRGYALAMTVVYTTSLLLRYALGRLMTEPPSRRRLKRKRGFFARIISVVQELRGDGQGFGESVLVRCAVACFGAFVFGMYRLIAGGFLYYDLFGLVAGFLITPLTVLVLSARNGENERMYRYAELSRAALMFITVFALRGYMPFGFTAAFIAAIFVTFWTAASVGALRGCAAGLFAGLACGGIESATGSGGIILSYSLAAAPCILASMGLCCGALKKLSIGIAAATACIIGITLGVAVDGYTAMTRLVPDVFSAAILFLSLNHFRLLPRLPIFTEAAAQTSDEGSYIIAKRQNDTEVRISALSEAFAGLSETVYALSDKLRRPGVIDLKNVCDGTFDRYCRKCAMSSHCLERDCSSTLDARSKITAALYSKGIISLDDVPKYMRDRCYNIIPITQEINTETARLIEGLIKNDKTEAFAIDYELMSKLLAEQISANGAEYTVDDELTKKLRRTLGYMKLPTSGALCYGTRRKRVVIGGVEMIRMKVGAEDIRHAVENTLGIPMGAPQFDIEEESVTVSMSARRRYSCEVAKASGIKEDESANGDSTAVFENREDYFYALISDGMGSGRDAAITSRICVTFAKRMLLAGNGKAVTFEMLNGFIRSRSTECSASVDLAEIDLVTGEACFVKSGAAPSFVVRDGSLYKLQSKTVPIGIMEEIDAEKIKFDLCNGDVLIMMSDGITQSLEDGVWLANLITYEWDDRLDAMAEKILDNAAFANKRSDDMTVVLVRVTECEEE